MVILHGQHKKNLIDFSTRNMPHVYEYDTQEQYIATCVHFMNIYEWKESGSDRRYTH